MKTVYIVGAGFSVPAGAPTQDSILSEAFRIFDDKSDKFRSFKEFLANQLHVSEKNITGIKLEDIFTPLDRCLSESSQFRGIGLGAIMRIREAIFYVVGQTIKRVTTRDKKNRLYVDLFAKYLTDKSSARKGMRYTGHDPVSVISTNWDDLLDNAIYNAINSGGHDAVVDYCCHISSREEHDETIKPGLEKLGQGGV